MKTLKHKLATLIAAVMLLASVGGLLAACTPQYKVTFIRDYPSRDNVNFTIQYIDDFVLDVQTVTSGGLAVDPGFTPSGNLQFVGWSKTRPDSPAPSLWTFTTPVTGDTVLYAVYKEENLETVPRTVSFYEHNPASEDYGQCPAASLTAWDIGISQWIAGGINNIIIVPIGSNILYEYNFILNTPAGAPNALIPMPANTATWKEYDGFSSPTHAIWNLANPVTYELELHAGNRALPRPEPLIDEIIDMNGTHNSFRQFTAPSEGFYAITFARIDYADTHALPVVKDITPGTVSPQSFQFQPSDFSNYGGPYPGYESVWWEYYTYGPYPNSYPGYPHYAVVSATVQLSLLAGHTYRIDFGPYYFDDYGGTFGGAGGSAYLRVAAL